MSYSILDLKNDLTGVLHQTQLNQITNIDGLINRAARKLLLDVDPQETKRTVEFVNPVFNTVFDYPIADDVKGNKLIDIFPQVNRLPRDIWSQAYNQAFDVAKQNIWTLQNMFTMNFNSGIKTIKVNAPLLNTPVIIDNMSNITTNGIWSLPIAANNATNLTVNNTNYVQGSGSLQFDIVGAGSGYIQNSTLAPVDLSVTKNQSSFFVWLYTPSGVDVTLVDLYIGSSSANYYIGTVSQNQQGVAFINGWNLLQFDWSAMSVNGTPDATKLKFAQINISNSANLTGVKVNGLESILGTVLSYSYYSKYIFRDGITNAFQETVTADNNLINLDTESYNLLFNLVAYYSFQQQQGLDASFFDNSFFLNEYNQGVARYKNLYRSEVQKPQTTYYAQPNKSYGRFIGRGWN